MIVQVERGAAAAVSRQIADQIRAQCLSGRVPPGTRVPSVRQVARDLHVNQNTVLRVYERLAAEGLLEVRHGDGTYVAEKIPARQFKAERLRFVDEMNHLVLRGHLLGLDRGELHALVDEAVTQAGRWGVSG